MWRVLLCGFVVHVCVPALIASEPLKLSSGTVAGNILSKPAPPNLCLFHAGGGAWTARLDIDQEGKVVKAEMVGRRDGDAVYLAWVRQFRYRPFQQEGRVVAVTGTVTVYVSCGG